MIGQNPSKEMFLLDNVKDTPVYYLSFPFFYFNKIFLFYESVQFHIKLKSASADIL